MKKGTGFLLSALAVFSFFCVPSALAGNPPAGELDLGMTEMSEIGLGEADPRSIVAAVIRVILGFLGTVAVVIILLGGFKWMTAAGNQDKVDEARKLITAGIIGLLIILASYAIANFVITQLMSATGVDTGA